MKPWAVQLFRSRRKNGEKSVVKQFGEVLFYCEPKPCLEQIR